MRAAIVGAGVVTALAEGAPALHEALVAGRTALEGAPGQRCARIPNSAGPLELALRAVGQIPEIPKACWILCATSGADPARDVSSAPIQSLAERLQAELALTGAAMTVQAACASALVALGLAADLAAEGECVLVVAVDCLSRSTQGGFASLGAVSADRPAPMSEERDGLVLGEAAAAFLVVPDGEGPWIRAWGESCDAQGLSQPDEQGHGLARAVTQACVAAPDLVFAHATGTRLGDAAEARVLAPLGAPVTGTKGAVGHCLGAAGGVDVAVALVCMATGVAPPMAGVRTPILPVLTAPARMPIERVLLLAAGLGGFDAALLLERS